MSQTIVFQKPASPQSNKPDNTLDIQNATFHKSQSPFPIIQIYDANIKRVLDIQNAPLTNFVLKKIKALQITQATRMQSFMWPSFMKLLNLISIGGSNIGKSYGYLMPLLSSIHTRDLYKGIPRGFGPHALILCPTWRGVEKLEEQFKTILGPDMKNFKILAMYEGQFSKSDSVRRFLENGYYIIISTPEIFLKEAFGESRFCHIFSGCGHLILEDANDLFRFYPAQTKSVLAHFHKYCKQRVEPLPIHYTITSQTWMPCYTKLIDCYMKNNVELCFSSYFEAALYYNLNIVFSVPSNKEWMDRVINAINQKGRIVVCVKDEVACELLMYQLEEQNIEVSVVHEEIGRKDGFNDVTTKFKQSTNSILIVSDKVLLSTFIKNAQILIHYDIPELPDTFENRFILIHDHVKQQAAKCYLILNQEHGKFSLNVTRVLMRLNMDIPEELQKLKKSYLKTSRSERPLCNTMKAFGNCNDHKCAYRHFIDESLDQPALGFKINQDIKFIVTHYVNCTYFYIRPVAWNKKADDLVVTNLSEYFRSHQQNPSGVNQPEVDSVYLAKSKNGNLFRVKILKTVNGKTSAFDIDKGTTHTVAELSLYDLSPNLAAIEPLCIEAYVANVMTLNTYYEWTPAANNHIQNLIANKELEGKIKFFLGSTLFLEPVVHREINQLDKFRLFQIKFGIKSQLIDNELAKDNPDHIRDLRKYCPESMRFEIEAYKVTYQHAFLDEAKYNCVFLRLVARLNLLFITLSNHESLIVNMQNDISKLIDKGYNTPLKTVAPDVPALAKYSVDGKWYRVRIIKEISIDEVVVLFADFGDVSQVEKSSLLEIPPKLLQVLPFQAIECSLYGINFKDLLCDVTIEHLYELSQDENGCFKEIIVKPMKALERGQDSAGKHYKILLYAENSENKYCCFAKEQLSFGLVTTVEGTCIDNEPEFITTPPKEEKEEDENTDIEEESESQNNLSLPQDHSNSKEKKSYTICSPKESPSKPSSIPESQVAQASSSKSSNIPESQVAQASSSKSSNVPESQVAQASSSKSSNVPESQVTKESPSAHGNLNVAIQQDNSNRVRVSWWQTKSTVHLELLEENLQNQLWSLDVKNNFLLFNVLNKILFLEFFSTIGELKTKICVKDMYLQVTLTKSSNEKWISLTKSSLKDPFIKPNLNYLYDVEEADTSLNSMNFLYMLAATENEEVDALSSDEEGEVQPRSLFYGVTDKNAYDI